MKIIRTKIAREIEQRKDGQVLWINDPKQLRHLLMAKIQEEAMEVCQEIKVFDRDKLKDEIGDLLLVLQEVARFYHISNTEIVDSMQEKKDKKGGFFNEIDGFAFMVSKGTK